LLEFQRQAALPGFRKGKAPVDLVSRQYERQIREELLNRATHQALEQATKDQQLKPVSPFEVHTARIDEAGTITLEAVVEVEPVFKLSEYKGIAIAPPSSEITAQEREQALASLQESMAEQVPIGEGQTKEKKLPSIDDELAKDLGFKSLVELTEHVEAKLREKKRADSKHAVENAISDELLRRNVFEVPPRLVSRQIERLRRDFKMRLSSEAGFHFRSHCGAGGDFRLSRGTARALMGTLQAVEKRTLRGPFLLGRPGSLAFRIFGNPSRKDPVVFVIRPFDSDPALTAGSPRSGCRPHRGEGSS
ncbi:MAG: hypothetical protein HYU33_04095, partial [Candidatus Omnitrophica bacterium]|nr:hypothetical protein [Candidatus Omnitrophota bacterium]